MKNLSLITGIMLIFLSPLCAGEMFPKIRLRDGKFYAGKEELHLVTMGYNPLRPGQGDEHLQILTEENVQWIDLDLERIKAAGFNSIRTWHMQNEKVQELARKHGLWVVGGIWTRTNLDLDDAEAVERAVQLVAQMARSYSRFPNTAGLLLLNEPNVATLLKQDPEKVKRYFDRLVETAHENCPDVPVSFSNWPNAAFVDPSSWDFISQNLYAWSLTRFQSAIGYRGFIEGIRKICTRNKKQPFYVSECGGYAPVPNPEIQNNENRACEVPDEEKQAELASLEWNEVHQLGLAGAAYLCWCDCWSATGQKDVHDMHYDEWYGVVSFDENFEGTLRPAYYALQRANQAIVTEPDSEMIYRGKIPVSVDLADEVERIELLVDGKSQGVFPREEGHWFRHTIEESRRDLVAHEVMLRAFGRGGVLLNKVKRTAWTARENRLPVLQIEHHDKKGRAFFTFKLEDERGDGIPNAKIHWGLLDPVAWLQKDGMIQTDANGVCELEKPMPGNFLLMGGGYEYQRGGFQRKITDLDLYKP